MALATGSSQGELRAPDGKGLFAGHVDVCDAFYHFGLPEAIRDYFALPSLAAGDAGLTSWKGRALQPWDRLWLALAVLPMGRSRALYWCHRILRSIV